MYKFRGKTTQNEWVYGGFFKRDDKCFIIEDRFVKQTKAYLTSVDCQTVGISTMRFDKKFKEVFAGDYILYKKDIYLVKYDLNKFVFVDVKTKDELSIDNIEFKSVEVIGNEHDNSSREIKKYRSNKKNAKPKDNHNG